MTETTSSFKLHNEQIQLFLGLRMVNSANHFSPNWNIYWNNYWMNCHKICFSHGPQRMNHSDSDDHLTSLSATKRFTFVVFTKITEQWIWLMLNFNDFVDPLLFNLQYYEVNLICPILWFMNKYQKLTFRVLPYCVPVQCHWNLIMWCC